VATTRRLLGEMAGQVSVSAHVLLAAPPNRLTEAEELGREHRSTGLQTSTCRAEELSEAVHGSDTVYLTRLHPALTYGPEHLQDGVIALDHSGAAVASASSRFSFAAGPGFLLDRPHAHGERPGSSGLPGTSLWYAAAGMVGEHAEAAYRLHGCNLVVLDDRYFAGHPGERLGAVPHRTVPPQLSWWRAPTEVRTAPASYFAEVGTVSRSRTTRSDSVAARASKV